MNKIKVEKMSVRKLVKVSEQLKNLPKEMLSLSTSDSEKFLADLPLVIVGAIDFTADIIVECVDGQITKEQLLDSSLEECLDLVTNILEVNNIKGILQRIKKVQEVVKQ